MAILIILLNKYLVARDESFKLQRLAYKAIGGLVKILSVSPSGMSGVY